MQRVSIHALLAECDEDDAPAPQDHEGFNPRTPCGVRLRCISSGLNSYLFQSTHSLRSATEEMIAPNSCSPVSIHALLAECDLPRLKPDPRTTCFNPRTPCGVRRAVWHTPSRPPGFNPRTPCGVRHPLNLDPTKSLQFQSTHSLRSATIKRFPCLTKIKVSIHALLAECDFLPPKFSSC